MLHCRTCTKPIESKDITNIFDNLYEDEGKDECLQISQALEVCCGIKCEHDKEQLPINICEMCIRKLWKAFKFRRMCQESEIWFRKKLAEENDLISKNTLDSVGLQNSQNIELKYGKMEEVYLEENDVEGTSKGIHQLVQLKLEHLNADETLNLKGKIGKKSEKTFVEIEYCPIKAEEFLDQNPTTVLTDEGSNKKYQSKEKCNDQKRKEYICDICKKKCFKISHIKEHMRTHSNERPYECTMCNSKFSHCTSWTYHMNNFHNGTPIHECSICGEKFNKKNLFDRHVKTHIQEEYRCNICNAEFTLKGNLTSHIKRYHFNKHECDICHRSYENEQKLISHKNVKHKNSSCVLLKVDFLEEERDLVEKSLKNDQLSQMNENLKTCAVCNVEFNDKTLLKIHYKTHPKDIVAKCKKKRWSAKNKYIGRPYPCDYCSKIFYWKNHYDNHIRIHTGEKPFECKICSKRFKQTSALSTHMKLHTGKLYLCPICGTRSATKYTLNTHMQMHNDVKQHQCDECPAEFYLLSALKDHIDRYHSNNQYECSICLKIFRTKKILSAHMLIHNGYPFACVLCDSSYKAKKLLRKHLEIEHNLTCDLDAIQRYVPLKMSNLRLMFQDVEEGSSASNGCEMVAEFIENNDAIECKDFDKNDEFIDEEYLYELSKDGQITLKNQFD